jgi:hypothetical protein
LTADQIETFLRHRGNGATMRESAAMVGVSEGVFVATWKRGAADLDRDTESPEAVFVREARAAFARHIATKRAQAAAAAGSRESADLLAYVRQLEAEDEPLALAEESNGPRYWLDIREDLADDPEAVALFAEHDATMLKLLAIIVRRDEAKRGAVAA